MKKLFLLAAILSTQLMYSSEQRESSTVVEVVVKDFFIKSRVGTVKSCLLLAEFNSRTQTCSNFRVVPYDERTFRNYCLRLNEHCNLAGYKEIIDMVVKEYYQKNF